MNGNNTTDKAIRNRVEEFVKFKRDMTARCAETIGATDIRTENLRHQLAETERLQQIATQALQEIEQLDADSWTEEKLPSELAAAMKKLNDCRLELIRQTNRQEEQTAAGSGRSVPEAKTSPALELTSLSFWQLFRLGIIVSLPVTVILIFGLAAIAVAVYFSTRF